MLDDVTEVELDTLASVAALASLEVETAELRAFRR
jgi:hypothetical protein